MKLEYFADGLAGGPMLLLYEGTPDEVARLREALKNLSNDVGGTLSVSDLPFVESIDGCRLRAVCAKNSLGVRPNREAEFEWTLDSEAWRDVEWKLEPFGEHVAGVSFQYLNPGRGPEVLYSTTRQW